MNGKRILIFAAFLSALFSCREPEPDIAPNTLSVTNYSDAAVRPLIFTAIFYVCLSEKEAVSSVSKCSFPAALIIILTEPLSMTADDWIWF